MHSRQKFLDFLFYRWASNESSTVRHHLRRITLSSFIAVAGLAALCALNLQAQALKLVIIDVAFILIILAINIGIRFRLGYRISLLLLTTLYFLFCVAIALLETQKYIGIFWVLLLPMIAIPSLGKKLGMVYSISGGVLIGCILFDNNLLQLLPAQYGLAFNIQFLLAYIMISLFGHCSEALRVNLESDLRQKNRDLDALARTDSLTGLSNRRDILEKIKYEAIRSERTQRTFGIILGDIDSFKVINDRYGHSAGDTVLKTVAQTLMETIRAQDSVAHWGSDPSKLYGYTSRYGGEEFLILLPETDLDGAENAAEKLRQKIVELQISLLNPSPPIQITMSFGVALWQRAQHIETTIQYADQMLYRAKQQGRNQVQSMRLNSVQSLQD